uniref:Uncharacterized protein n=1 Tax=Malurus cyaneus samueli TaxID=2593467 RepID=A0A8C5THS9_9PASS
MLFFSSLVPPCSKALNSQIIPVFFPTKLCSVLQVRPKVPLLRILQAAGAQGDTFTLKELRPRDGNIVHGRTAHLVACFRCARMMLKRKGSPCPVCRKEIRMVIRIFMG